MWGISPPDSRAGARASTCLLVALFFAWTAAKAPAAELPEPVAVALAQADIPPASVALFVKPVGQPPLVAHRADHPMNPASLIKLVTTWAGLELLGPDHRWSTEIYAHGRIDGDRLHGDLIFRGGGDPALTLERFWLALRQLRARGLREIRGDLVIDRSFFDLAPQDPAAFDGEPLKPYNTPPDALLVNFFSQRVFLSADSGASPRIAPEVPLAGIELVNRVRLSAGACDRWKDALSYALEPSRRGLALVFSGHYPRACGEQSLYVAIPEADRYVAGLFRTLWQELGGRWRGRVRSGLVPEDARLLLSLDSPPLAMVVRDINKFSNNVMARQLYLTLGAELLRPPANLDKAALAVDSLLARRGLEFVELVMGNGAGLSRETRISARHLAALLETAMRSPWAAEFEASLPILAVDGTLGARLKDSPLSGRARMKTGSLDDVRGIAGFIRDAQERRWIVVFLVNHPNAAKSRAAQDALLAWVWRQP